MGQRLAEYLRSQVAHHQCPCSFAWEVGQLFPEQKALPRLSLSWSLIQALSLLHCGGEGFPTPYLFTHGLTLEASCIQPTTFCGTEPNSVAFTPHCCPISGNPSWASSHLTLQKAEPLASPHPALSHTAPTRTFHYALTLGRRQPTVGEARRKGPGWALTLLTPWVAATLARTPLESGGVDNIVALTHNFSRLFY